MTADLTPDQVADIEKMLGSPLALPSEFTNWWIEWLTGELQPQVLALGGAELIFFRAAETIATSESRTQTTFGDLATVGPQLTGLSNGRWLFFWGANMEAGGGDTTGLMGLEFGLGVSDEHAAKSRASTAGDMAPASYARLVTLNGDDSNDVTCKYAKVSGGTPSWHERWLVGIRVGNV